MGRHVARNRKTKRSPLLLVGALAALSIGGVSTVAAFTSSATSPVTVAAGSINLTAGDKTSYTMDFGTGWKPGQTSSKTVILKNTGSIPLKYTMAVTGTPGTLAKKLDATAKVGSTSLYTGKLSVIKTTAARTLAAGASETISLGLTWAPAADDNTYQSASGNTTITFTATN